MIRKLIPLSLSVLVFAGCSSAERAGFKPKLTPNTEIHYVTAVHDEIIQKVQPPEGEARESIQRTDRSVGMHLKCTEVGEDGSAKIEWTLEFMAVSGEGRGVTPFDSRDPAQADSPMGIMLSQLIGEPAIVTIDSTGKVVDYQDPATVGGGPVRQQMRELLSQDVFESNNLLSVKGAPENPAVGDTWETVRSVEMPYGMGTMLVRSAYTLASMEDADTAKLTVKGTMSMGPMEDGAEPPPTRLVIKMGEFTGYTLWDCMAGQAVKGEAVSRLVGSFEYPGYGVITIDRTSKTEAHRVTAEEFKKAAQAPPATPTAPDASDTAT